MSIIAKQLFVCVLVNLVLFTYYFRLSVENLSNARMYLLNLEIAACLESNDKCETAVTVFNNTLLNKLPCQLDSGFIFQSKISLSYISELQHGLKTSHTPLT
jgi:hypothetical protein